MKRRMLFVLASFVLSACGEELAKEGEECSSDEDCEEGLECHLHDGEEDHGECEAHEDTGE